LAYLSADFHDHPTAYLMAELFERHDRNKFEILGISSGPDRRSEMRSRLIAAFDRFVDVRRVSDLEAARLLRDAEVDIAIDLKGFTQNCRPNILAHRPAPIQVNYLGYPGTLGAEYIDYILADEFVIPGDHQIHYSEKVVYLPGCYQVNDTKRKIAERTPARAEVGLPEQGFVFCCFNNSFKLTPRIFDIWMRLLSRIDNSVLWLLQGSATAESNLRREAQARDIDPSRLIFAPRMKLEKHLARHRLADLFLDTLPYNAHTTASDALWTGLPVVTCAGTTFAGRVAGSLLQAVGLPELVTTTLEDYEALALRMATDQGLLRESKEKLARNRLTAPLFDSERFRVHIETAYTTMRDIHQRGEESKAFAVSR
jgi:predicted O-linked N-acetylglucosamine transferase (SPINDLY family)